MTDHDVCIVGLGPTGLLMAHLLAERGVRVLVLEREPEYYGMARAVYTDDECLRVMQTAGVADAVHADMVSDLPVQWVRADGSVLAQFHDPSRRNGWPTSNFLYQPAFESTLEERLRERPEVTIRRGRAVLDLEQDADGVTITHEECRGAGYGRGEADLVPGTTESTRVPWVIAADGGRSVIRTGLGIEMTGTSFPQRWLVVDLRAKGEGETPFAHLPYFDFVCDAALPVVSCPQPMRRHRFEFMLHDHDRTEDFESEAKVAELLSRYVDTDAVVVDRSLVYTFNALVATRWRDGRVLLAGDAAHMTPQFIGQGMNAGVRDADNLSWKLAAVLAGAPDSLLDSYEAERRPHATAMIRLSVFNKDIVSTGRELLCRGRDISLPVMAKLPGTRRYLGEARMKPRPRYRRGRYLGLPRGLRGPEGALFPQPTVRRGDEHLRLDDVLGTGWSLVGIGVDPRAVVDAERYAGLAPTWVALHPIGSRANGRPGATPQDLVDVEASDAELTRWLRRVGVPHGSVVVLRPDRYVLGVVHPGADDEVATLVRRTGLVAGRAKVTA